MSEELTPAQETAKGLADAFSLRMVTILANRLEQILSNKSIEDAILNEKQGYSGAALIQYYCMGFLALLAKERPDVLARIKDRRLISPKRLDKVLTKLEASLNLEHRVEWEIVTPDFYKTVSFGSSREVKYLPIYGSNGYVEVCYLGEESAPVKKDRFKRSGHLTDQLLKYNYPKDTSSQLDLFDTLQEHTKEKINEAVSIKREELVEGIQLSPSETKLIDCLCKLLHERSQTSDSGKDDYYTGNQISDLVPFGGEQTPAPKLAFTLYEIAQEYKGGERVAGKDIENVKQILTELDQKSFLMTYKETIHKKGGGRIEKKIEEFSKLLRILKISQTEYSQEDMELSKKEQTIVALNPIFRRQIDTKFIQYPSDIIKRTVIAYGSHNVSEIAIKLRDYLMREHSHKRYEPEIGLDRLYYQLAEKWMKESRKAKVKEYTDKALETAKKLGLLLSYEVKIGASGEPKVVFKLDKNWG